MPLTIEKKALKLALKKNCSFVIDTISASGGCYDIPVKSLSVDIKENFIKNNNFLEFEYEKVKVFIEKSLQLEENILIYQKLKLPIIGAVFGIKGVSIQYI